MGRGQNIGYRDFYSLKNKILGNGRSESCQTPPCLQSKEYRMGYLEKIYNFAPCVIHMGDDVANRIVLYQMASQD